jgi:hypothetical protein
MTLVFYHYSARAEVDILLPFFVLPFYHRVGNIQNMAMKYFGSSISWMWKINKNDPWYFPGKGEVDDDRLTYYSAIETAKIEEKFQEKAKEAILDDYHIDFRHFLHISNWDGKNERLVRRFAHQTELETNKSGPQRNGRFLPTPLPPRKSFGQLDGEGLSWFLLDISSHFNLPPSPLNDPYIRRSMVERGKIREELAQELINIKDGTLEQVVEKCLRCYGQK